jgi:epoxyqueuosine reductase QueG
MMRNRELSLQIEKVALACGYDQCGIIPLCDMEGFKDRLQERIRQFPESAVFYDALKGLSAIKERFPWAKSVVICTFWYGRFKFPKELRGKYSKSFLLSANNESCKDMLIKRKELNRWFSVRTIRHAGGNQLGHISIGPLRYAAMMAGLGIIRRNNFLYTDKGSYVSLEGYVIDRECELYHDTSFRPCPDNCNMCQKTCKTKALRSPYSMNPLKCISFWTTFGKGICPPDLEEEMFEEWICGCDTCQDVCPYNRGHNWNEGEEYPGLSMLADELLPERILEQSDHWLSRHIAAISESHIRPDEIETIRRCTKRSLRNSLNHI